MIDHILGEDSVDMVQDLPSLPEIERVSSICTLGGGSKVGRNGDSFRWGGIDLTLENSLSPYLYVLWRGAR